MEFVVPGPPVKAPADVPNGVAVYVPIPIPKLHVCITEKDITGICLLLPVIILLLTVS